MSETNMSTSECVDNTPLEDESILRLTENGIEGFEILCRLCANRSDHLIPIYSEEGISNDLSNKMNLYLPVKVSEADTLPLQCCYQCASTVLTWHELVIASVEADRRLRDLQLEAEKHIQAQNATNSELEQAERESDSEDDRLQLRSMDREKLNKQQSDITINYESPEQNEYLKDLPNTANENENLEIISDELKPECEVKTKRARRRKNEIIANYFCDVCSKGFTRKFDMKKHRQRKHKNVPEPLKMHPKNVQNEKNLELLERCKVSALDGHHSYQCEICHKLIRHPYNFIRHQTIHTGVREFFCHICGKSFRIASTLNRHIKEFHCRIKNYSCDVCGREFAAKASLNDHKNLHTNERPFVCDTCGKSFKQKACLRIHKMFHSNVFRFSCPICGKKYHRARDLKVHSWLHTGHRPYSCDICGSMFRLSQDLKRHSKVHNKLFYGDSRNILQSEQYLNEQKIPNNRKMDIEHTK